MSLFRLLYVIVLVFVQIPTDIPPDIPPLPTTTQNLVRDNVTRLTKVLQFDEYTKQVSFSPDGSLIGVARQVQDLDYTITIYAATSGQPLSYITGTMDLFGNMVWSPDNTRLAVASSRLTGGLTEVQNVRTYTITLGSDDQFYTFGNSDILITSVNQNPETWTSSTNQLTPLAIAWSPNSRLVALAFSDHFEIYSVLENRQLFASPLDRVSRVEWSPDGRYILTTSLEFNQTKLWGVP